ncbi:Xre family transcriptional regulator [Micromonospora pisi]|uniref:Xre family transcriptional regulator n=1 Tax=Micromonospora pisi TaxID=589240 RepID=A0A495JQR5_9ACTN|nr:helix-turn-helix transcriptional regulator [Micromonospora pisi]RKR91320.1 Xre family transcriptional regulator [Micromonospora pisi]
MNSLTARPRPSELTEAADLGASLVIMDSHGRPPDRKNSPLGEFLRSRRASVGPEEVGVTSIRRRRVSGLRREELARLAGVSVDYYTRLEQGRHATASYAVLESIATALLLTPAERAYLHRLAKVPGTIRSPAPQNMRVRPETIALLNALGTTPGVVLGPNLDVLATNAAARRLYGDLDALAAAERNAIHWMLFHPDAERLHGDEWAEVAAEMIGMLRLRAGRALAHPDVRRLVQELGASSAFFRKVWAEQTVSTGSRAIKHFQHPEAGAIELIVESLTVKHAEDQTVVVLMPPPGSPSERSWRAVMARDPHAAR